MFTMHRSMLQANPNLRSHDYISVEVLVLDQGRAIICKYNNTRASFPNGELQGEFIGNVCPPFYCRGSFVSVFRDRSQPGPFLALFYFSSSDDQPYQQCGAAAAFYKFNVLHFISNIHLCFSKARVMYFLKSRGPKATSTRYIQTYPRFCPFSRCFYPQTSRWCCF